VSTFRGSSEYADQTRVDVGETRSRHNHTSIVLTAVTACCQWDGIQIPTVVFPMGPSVSSGGSYHLDYSDSR
jgi:hypothetical protein